MTTQRFRKFKYILSFTFIVMLLHTIEEYVTKVYDADPFIVFTSHYFNVSPVAIYALIQILVLTLILMFLMQLSCQRFDISLAALLGFVFILELLHPYNSIRMWGYYPGLYTGIVLVILGFFYYRELLRGMK